MKNNESIQIETSMPSLDIACQKAYETAMQRMETEGHKYSQYHLEFKTVCLKSDTWVYTFELAYDHWW